MVWDGDTHQVLRFYGDVEAAATVSNVSDIGVYDAAEPL
jgi:hypothetical protein